MQRFVGSKFLNGISRLTVTKIVEYVVIFNVSWHGCMGPHTLLYRVFTFRLNPKINNNVQVNTYSVHKINQNQNSSNKTKHLIFPIFLCAMAIVCLPFKSNCHLKNKFAAVRMNLPTCHADSTVMLFDENCQDS